MNKKSGTSKDAADKLVRGIKRKTCKQYSTKEKIRMVPVGLRGGDRVFCNIGHRRLGGYFWPGGSASIGQISG